MGKYVIALCIVVLIGSLFKKAINKYSEQILIGIIYTVMLAIIIPLYIITFPIKIISLISDATVTESKIIREYDRIFYQADTMDKVARINKKIRRFQKVIEHRLSK